ncbi:MAG: DNA-binding protein [Deltaproteobacteria bacterium]|nr:DNA-binding protein [Deltaproteobacteria bacterium]
MDSRTSGGIHLVRLDRGEDVLVELTGYLARQCIGAGIVHGIGAVDGVVVGAYLPAASRYEKVSLEGEWELLSFQGTVALLDGAPFVHPHVVLSNARAEVRGGHLFAARVAVTGEFTILEAGITVSRQLVEEVGLKLWSFDDPDGASSGGD